uniref:NadR/Ttd14 AAA domain-containing protein n=1 Tax=Plectus sambesii TaxID=2011161 RepID=A0A914WJY3_9BILA
MSINGQSKTVYKVVLTGGPCGGKTTGQDRLATFFENLGWKVFRVPETATVLINGGVKFNELSEEQAFQFQEDLLLTLLRIEQVFFNQAEMIAHQNVLVICDRGAMDPSAYIDHASWQRLLAKNKLNTVDMRDNRYNQIVHMVTAADGADNFYTCGNNAARSEGIAQAIEVDKITRQAWVGHPYVDMVDNKDCDSFDDKILKVLQVVCDRAGVEYHDRLAKNSRKRKWLVLAYDHQTFPSYEEFDVIHDYLRSVGGDDVQIRIRKRGQGGRWAYTMTTRRDVRGERVETRMQITKREYENYSAMKDKAHATLYKRRRCFNFGQQYFHLDIYVPPLPPQSPNPRQLMILETYTTALCGDDEPALPDFVTIGGEITLNPQYSMFNLSRNDKQLPMANGTTAKHA